MCEIAERMENSADSDQTSSEAVWFGSTLFTLTWASLWENRSSGFPTRSNKNQAVQPQKMARGLKFQI